MVQIISSELCSLGGFTSWLEKCDVTQPLLIQISAKEFSSQITEHHKKIFPWHYRDSVRSFDNPDMSNLSQMEFSYANRMRQHWERNQLEDAYRHRNSVISMWDPDQDPVSTPKPCLLILKFVKSGRVLDLHAMFRKRDLVRRLPVNVWLEVRLLMSMAKHLTCRVGMLYDYSCELIRRQEDVVKWHNQLKL